MACPTGQPQRFVEAVVEAVTLDGSVRRAMSEAARASLLHRGWEQVVGQFEACLLEALEGAEPASRPSARGSGRQSMFPPLA